MGRRGFCFLGNFNSLNQTSPARQLKRGALHRVGRRRLNRGKRLRSLELQDVESGVVVGEVDHSRGGGRSWYRSPCGRCDLDRRRRMGFLGPLVRGELEGLPKFRPRAFARSSQQTRRWREMDSNYWSRHGEAPLGRAMWFSRTAPPARRGADPERDEEFESISLQRRVSGELSFGTATIHGC